jgi:cytochrome c oxidase cbb3-type subunit II
LHRVGGRYSDEWQRAHLINPRDVVPESNMPAFPWLVDAKAKDTVAAQIDEKMQVLRGFANLRGIPTYSDEEIKGAKAAVGDKTEMDVLIAYLQVMGTSLKATK